MCVCVDNSLRMVLFFCACVAGSEIAQQLRELPSADAPARTAYYFHVQASVYTLVPSK